MFVILAVVIVLSSVATVVTKSIVRAATYLLFVLLGTAGMYFLMGYTFLGAVQTMVYAGGIIVLYVFAILLTKGGNDAVVKRTAKDASWGFVLTLVGFLTFIGVLLKQNLFKNVVALSAPEEPVGDASHNSINVLCFHQAMMVISCLLKPSVFCCWHVSWLVCSLPVNGSYI